MVPDDLVHRSMSAFAIIVYPISGLPPKCVVIIVSVSYFSVLFQLIIPIEQLTAGHSYVFLIYKKSVLANL